MTSHTFTLTVGSRIKYDGDVWSVAGLSGTTVLLQRPAGPPLTLRTADLLAAPGFALAGDASEPVAALGATFGAIGTEEYQDLLERERHVLEVLTGYRAGSVELALADEPRPAYETAVPMWKRYEAKAAELGASPRTVRRMVSSYKADGLAGLVNGYRHRQISPTGRVDPRWIASARDVLSQHVDASQPSVQHIIDRTNALAQVTYNDDVQLPSRATAQRVLREITKGQQAFSGTSAKQKRSIAGRPQTPYGRLRADRAGQYILLDTSPLDVFAMDPLTLRWVGMQLTLALDLGTRCVTGLRLSHVSAKAVDAALVVFETLNPGSRAHTSSGLLPYGGVPDALYVTGQQEDATQAGLPGTHPETLVIDHGKIYVSAHLRAVCERIGTSIQPARVLTSTDKAPIERIFRTIREDLLEALPGYKGPDVYSRGKNVEDLAFYFSHELEGLIRDWVVTRYHQRPHAGLRNPDVPGLELTPAEMWDQMVTTGGELQVPRRPDLVYDFLPVAWRTIQHYGVQVNDLRYDGHGLEGLRGTSSPYSHVWGKWPVRYDPDDASRVYFQRPDDLSWWILRWEHARDFTAPFSVDALHYARRLARIENRHPDDRQALSEVLERWDAGLLHNPTERRIALRISEQRSARVASLREQDVDVDADSDGGEHPTPLPTLSLLPEPIGDDDDIDEIDADYYSDAFEVG